MEALLHAAADFVVADLDLVTEPAALAAARRSLDDSGLLLLGEVPGVRENPLLIRALIGTFPAAGTLADHRLLWSGDGRITAGHLAVLAERAAAGALEVILSDGTIGAGWSWSQRDEAMAGRILAAAAAGTRTPAVAGNAHTPVSQTDPGVPLGACLAQRRPGAREIRINYGGGYYCNLQPRRFRCAIPRQRQIRLYQQDGALVLDLPSAEEAVVPQRSQSRLPPAREEP